MYTPPLFNDGVAIEEDVPAALLVPLVQLLHKLPVARQPRVLHRAVVPLPPPRFLPRPAPCDVHCQHMHNVGHSDMDIALHKLRMAHQPGVLHNAVVRYRRPDFIRGMRTFVTLKG